MKKIISINLMIFFLSLFYFDAHAQQKSVSLKKNTKELVADRKFWFSEKQLIARAIFAKQANQLFLRHYINGIEFTEESPVKNYCFSDTRFVFRVDPEEKQVKTVSIVSDPNDLKIPDPQAKLSWIYANYFF